MPHDICRTWELRTYADEKHGILFNNRLKLVFRNELTPPRNVMSLPPLWKRPLPRTRAIISSQVVHTIARLQNEDNHIGLPCDDNPRIRGPCKELRKYDAAFNNSFSPSFSTEEIPYLIISSQGTLYLYVGDPEVRKNGEYSPPGVFGLLIRILGLCWYQW